MSQISNCYWFQSLTELQAVHGDDIGGDGIGKVFLSDDILFIKNLSDQVFVYVCTGYSATEIDDLPYQFTGPYRTDFGYPIFIILDLDYSASIARIDEISSTTPWDKNQNTEDISETFDALKMTPMPAVALSRADNYTSFAESQAIDDTSEADFLEESGADLDWLSDGVQLGGVPGTGVEPYAITPHGLNPAVSDYTTKAGVRGQSNIYVDISGTTTIGIRQINSDGSITTLSTAAPTFNATGYYYFSLLMPSGDKIIFGDYLYTGSKAEQGRLFIYDIDASYNLVNLQTIESPVPTRQGYMGKIVGVSKVDDTGTGTEQIHILTNCDEEIWILSDDNNYATVKQIIALDRNDYLYLAHGSRNRFVIVYYDDSASGYVLSWLHYDGTTWVQHNTSAATPQQRITWGNWKSESVFVGYDQSISSTRIWSVVGTTVTIEYNFNSSTQGYMIGTTVGLWTEDVVAFRRYDATPSTFFSVWDISTPSSPVQLYEYLNSWHQNPTSIWATQDTANNLRVIYLKIYESPNHIIMTIKGREGTLYSYNEGHYYFRTTEASKLELPENITTVQSASVSYAKPANSEIRFAISIDGGITWLTWDSGQADNVPITSLADIKTEGNIINYWVSSIYKLDDTIDREIHCAFALDRPATVADDQSPKVSNMVINYYTDLANYTYTPEARQVEDRRIQDGSLYAYLNGYKMHILNPLKTK